MRRVLAASGSVTALGVAAIVVSVGSASATPGFGATGTMLAKGTVADRVHIRSAGREQTDVLVQELTIAPGGTTGWHTHPGSAIVVVESGTFSVRSQHGGECVREVYGAGDAFVDAGRGHRHIGTNTGPDPVVVTVTYLLPAGSASPRIDVAAEDVPRACAQ